MSVEALISQAPIEAFDKRILHRTTGLDEIERDTVGKRPRIEVMTGELGAVVDSDGLRLSPLSND